LIDVSGPTVVAGVVMTSLTSMVLSCVLRSG
jgi:hypothetical protein